MFALKSAIGSGWTQTLDPGMVFCQCATTGSHYTKNVSVTILSLGASGPVDDRQVFYYCTTMARHYIKTFYFCLGIMSSVFYC